MTANPTRALHVETGAVTAELVVVLPVVAALIGVVAWLGVAQVERLTVVRAAGALVREAAINPAGVPALASKLGVGASVAETAAWVCVTASKPSGWRPLGTVQLKQRFCQHPEGQ